MQPRSRDNATSCSVLRNPSIHREMRELAGAFPDSIQWGSQTPLAADSHLIGNYRALVIMHRFNFGDGEVTILQLRQRVL